MGIIWELTHFSKHLIYNKYFVLFLIKYVLAKHFSSSACNTLPAPAEERKILWALLTPILSLQEVCMGHVCPMYTGQLQVEQWLPQQMETSGTTSR